MPYSPPAGDDVQLECGGSYTPPAGDNITLDCDKGAVTPFYPPWIMFMASVPQ